MSYKPFNKYVLRAPLYSFSFYKDLTKDFTVTDEKIKSICEDKLVKEALFLATPVLFFEIEKWLDNKIVDKKEIEKIKYSILKYVSRMSSRCTPFGLFSGTSVGCFSQETEIKLNVKYKNERNTRLDMNYLVALSKDLIKQKNIRNQVLFYPNSSIYEVGNQIRYVEYEYINGKRNHNIVAVKNSEYLQKILVRSKAGALKYELIPLLVDDEIDKEMADDFIEILINSQLLISELEPSVSGDDFLKQIVSVLSKKNKTEDLVNTLKQISTKIKKLDSNLGNNIDEYINLSESIKKLGTDFELKYLFQTDLLIKPAVNQLSNEVLDTISNGFQFLNKITLARKVTNLSKFSKAFYERYGDREVQISKALDVEVGIGYLQNQLTGDISPLIDDLILTPTENIIEDIKWSKIHTVLQKELLKSLINDDSIIYLKDEYFKDIDTSWNDLPDTMSSIIQIVNVDGKEKIVMSDISGSSAINVISRYCYGDKELLNYVKEIIEIESVINDSKLLTEIIHLPESRVGNVIAHPSFRKYEIPYLAKSNVSIENQIELDDLMISAFNNESISLRSKKHNKILLPRLSNAHTFSNNSLPIYHFLCDFQSQGLRNVIGFSLTPLQEEYEYLPRVEYDNIILSEACWFISNESIKNVLEQINDEIKLFKSINEWRNKFKIPQYVLLIEGDNELLVNLNNLTCIKMFLDTIKNKNKFKITEFLYAEDSIVKNVKGESYTNQVVVSFYKTNDL